MKRHLGDKNKTEKVQNMKYKKCTEELKARQKTK